MNRYQFKRAALAPYIWFMRYRTRGQSGFFKSALELHYYRPAFYRFIAAIITNPDIMYEVPLGKGDIVLDAGAYVGKWTARIHEKYQPRIYMFEPDPGSVKALNKRFAGHANIYCFAYGLGARDADLQLLQRGMGSTFFETSFDAGGEAVTVPLRDIAGALDELGLDTVDLFKLNIEGGEYDVLERLIETGRIPSIRCFMIQFHEWFDGAHKRRRRIRRALRKTHDQAWNYPFVWEMWVRKNIS